MRLINADALKAKIPELDSHDDCIDIWIKLDDVKDLIDNAPTVEPDKIQAIMSDYLIYRCEPQRPQGEWDYEQVALYGVCSNCGATVTSNLADIFLYEEIGKCPYNTNFCPNCGAYMRKGGAE